MTYKHSSAPPDAPPSIQTISDHLKLSTVRILAIYESLPLHQTVWLQTVANGGARWVRFPRGFAPPGSTTKDLEISEFRKREYKNGVL